MELLEQILRLRRGHGSVGEDILCQTIMHRYTNTQVFTDGLEDIAYAVTVPKADGSHYPVLWSCHVDTVHPSEGLVQQYIDFDTNPDVMLVTSDGKQPLGADDGAGVWLLMCMIDAKVPGTYIFHRGEERGGIGSRAMSDINFAWLKQFDHAIAFDRRGSKDVITHQARGRCCSDKFAQSFADLLGMGHKPSDTGVFTDTANYIYDIPECTNISCGYESEHSARELLDLDYVIKLKDRLIEVFIDAPILPVVRHVDDPDDSMDKWKFSYYDTKDYSVEEFDDLYRVSEFEIVDMKFHKLRELVRKDPDGATDLLIDLASRLIYNYEYDETNTDDYKEYSDKLNVGLA